MSDIDNTLGYAVIKVQAALGRDDKPKRKDLIGLMRHHAALEALVDLTYTRGMFWQRPDGWWIAGVRDIDSERVPDDAQAILDGLFAFHTQEESIQ